MDVKIHLSLKSDPTKKMVFDADQPITTAVLDSLHADKTREFLSIFEDDFPIDPVPPAWQIPVMRGKFRR